MNKLHLIHFSPSGTTRKVVMNIAGGIQKHYKEIYEYDMTDPKVRKQKLKFDENDFVILGIMSAIKLFYLAEEIIENLHGKNTAFVGVVLYGNGYYGNSLKKMKELMEKQSFKMIAAGAFIGQHSCSQNIAMGRPDNSDLLKIKNFGSYILNQKIIQEDYKLSDKIKIDWSKYSFLAKFKCLIVLMLPGVSVKIPKALNLKKILNKCNNCRVCERICPVEAINIQKKQIDLSKCIGCFGCINRCPTQAMQADSKALNRSKRSLLQYNKHRREPEIFI